MTSTTDRMLADALDRIDNQLSKQHGINKTFFMVINELLKNNVCSNLILKKIIEESEGKVDPSKLQEMKEISENYLSHDMPRHLKMSEAMLDAMQGSTEELEKKLNELFRQKDS